MVILCFVGSDVFGLELVQPGIQILTAAPLPDIVGDVDRGMASEGQRDGITRSGVDGPGDSFVLQVDSREIGAALHVCQDDTSGFHSKMLAEILDQVVAHGAWCYRGIQRSSNRLTFRCPHPYHETFCGLIRA